jgi:hypothetical protein
MSLSIHDHDRRKSGMKYVYAVLGRRAGGVSVGVNLNTNNACNWRCVYCEIPELVFGNAPHADLVELERELDDARGASCAATGWRETCPRNAGACSRTSRSPATASPRRCPEFSRSSALSAACSSGSGC